jgi:hypothetical protein
LPPAVGSMATRPALSDPYWAVGALIAIRQDRFNGDILRYREFR